MRKYCCNKPICPLRSNANDCAVCNTLLRRHLATNYLILSRDSGKLPLRDSGKKEDSADILMDPVSYL